jgi:hypothetical protein
MSGGIFRLIVDLIVGGFGVFICLALVGGLDSLSCFMSMFFYLY